MKKERYFRHFQVLILSFLCIMYFERYYLLTLLSPFTSVLEQYHITLQKTELIASINSIAGVILFIPIIGGLLITKFGMNRVGLWSTIITMVGCLLIFISFLKPFGHVYPTFSYITLLVGQFIAGLGLAPIMVVVLRMQLHWFKGKEYDIAMGITSSALRVGAFLGLFLGPIFLNLLGWPFPMLVPLILILIVLVLYRVYLRKCKHVSKKKPELHPAKVISGQSLKDLKSIMKHVMKERKFWLLSIIIFTYYGSVFPFLVIAPSYFNIYYNLEMNTASFISSILPFISVILTPIIGLLVSKIGKPLNISIIGSFCIPIGFIALLLHLPLVIPIILLGLTLSLTSLTIWLVITRLFKKEHYAVASGLLLWWFNAALWIMPWATGIIIGLSSSDSHKSPIAAIPLLLIASIVLTICQLYLLYLNKRNKLNLNTLNKG
ncbi:MAG: nitrate/nitrite transporter [Hyphomicrobiales bacterium]